MSVDPPWLPASDWRRAVDDGAAEARTRFRLNGIEFVLPDMGGEVHTDGTARTDWTGWIDAGAAEEGFSETVYGVPHWMLDDVREAGARMIASLFQVPPGLVLPTPTLPEPPMTTEPALSRITGAKVPETEVNARLAEHRCVWCGVPLPAICAPDDMFCSEGHHGAWMQAKVAKMDSGGVNVNREANWNGDYTAPQAPAPAPPAPNPWRSRRAPESAWDAHIFHTHPPRTQPPTPGHRVYRSTSVDGLTIHDETPLIPDLDYANPTEVRTGELSYGVTVLPGDPPGTDAITVTADVATPNGQDRLALGDPQIFGRPLVQSCKAPREAEGRWPLEQIEAFERAGYALWIPRSDEPGALREFAARWNLIRADGSGHAPYRECPRCRVVVQPVPVTAAFPTAERNTDPDGCFAGWTATLRRATKLCCRACLMPYPGAPLVPMAMREDDRGTWAFAVVGGHTNVIQRVSLEALARGLPTGVLWGDLYRGATEQVSPWRCVLPGCGAPAHMWMALSCGMAWHGYRWAPTDGVPLRMGWCPAHWYPLMYDLTSWSMEHAMYTGMSVNTAAMPSAPGVIVA